MGTMSFAKFSGRSSPHAPSAGAIRRSDSAALVMSVDYACVSHAYQPVQGRSDESLCQSLVMTHEVPESGERLLPLRFLKSRERDVSGLIDDKWPLDEVSIGRKQLQNVLLGHIGLLLFQ